MIYDYITRKREIEREREAGKTVNIYRKSIISRVIALGIASNYIK